MPPLQIYDRRERALVAAGDAVLTAAAALATPFRRRSRPQHPRRILLLRLERIGDLLMVLPAIADVRAAAPDAEIDLAVGTWNAGVAHAVPGVTHVHTLDASWLARGSRGTALAALLGTAAGWRSRRYDLGINFEPDVRSNLLLATAGAAWSAGYRSAGGGAVLDQALDYQTSAHTSDNARRLVAAVLPVPAGRGESPGLDVPASSQSEASALLSRAARPLIAMHVPGGRPVKQWEPEKFARVARELAQRRHATIVLTGGPDDRPLVDRIGAELPPNQVLTLSSVTDLLTVAAVLSRCDLMITGDTGPMHLAQAVGTPILAVFGPSDPRRYAPRGPRDRVVRIDFPCAPCNRIRLPPARCTGHTPDCLALIPPERVLEAALSMLDECGGARNVPT